LAFKPRRKGGNWGHRGPSTPKRGEIEKVRGLLREGKLEVAEHARKGNLQVKPFNPREEDHRTSDGGTSENTLNEEKKTWREPPLKRLEKVNLKKVVISEEGR